MKSPFGLHKPNDFHQKKIQNFGHLIQANLHHKIREMSWGGGILEVTRSATIIFFLNARQKDSLKGNSSLKSLQTPKKRS